MTTKTEEKKESKAKAKTAEKNYDDYSLSDAENDGWKVVLRDDPTVLSVSGTGAQAELIVRPARWQAEKTADGHLITAVGTSEESLAAAIASQQASIDSAPKSSTSAPVLNDSAGGEDGEGLGGAVPELKVERDPETGEPVVHA